MALVEDDLGVKEITGQESVEISSYTPNEVTLNTNTKHEELLILADQFDDGWRAKIDNNQTKVARANLIFRAIKIPGGKHKVIFYYWPKSFATGLQLSALSVATIIVLGWKFRYLSRTRNQQG